MLLIGLDGTGKNTIMELASFISNCEMLKNVKMFSGLSITESRGVTENITSSKMALLHIPQIYFKRSKFGANFINKHQWPPRPPDLNPCDYFLWCYLKSKVYRSLAKTLNDLKTNIRKEVEQNKHFNLRINFFWIFSKDVNW